MRIVPPGRFVMGEPEGASQRRKAGWGGPQIQVEIEQSFALARTEVTRGQFTAFLAESGYRPAGACRSMWPGAADAATPEAWQNAAWPTGEPQSDDHPMICINYEDVRAYLAWLNTKAPQGRRYVLPSEAQFEYAARAGTQGPWPWPGGSSHDICRHANVADRRYRAVNAAAPVFDCDDGHAFTAPVARYAVNPFGFHDLIGNVWEWVADCAADGEDLTSYPRDGSALEGAPADCSQRVTRGGGFVSPEWWSRVTARGCGHDPATRVSAMGFRVAALLE